MDWYAEFAKWWLVESSGVPIILTCTLFVMVTNFFIGILAANETSGDKQAWWMHYGCTLNVLACVLAGFLPVVLPAGILVLFCYGLFLAGDKANNVCGHIKQRSEFRRRQRKCSLNMLGALSYASPSEAGQLSLVPSSARRDRDVA